ncbi:Spo0E like sporulation regulatory protein [Tumebacillus sp. BK434]|uniref:aspartyl-phosphate phosphatase Spo0E family protein n=1 Tax=Tumebacillus sp. BK434 TaxID=2512169 RepID=UPI001048E40C|nr:aspartyl-phosphate phosphatase Spo0E family protein [Tumebacillus sp. BK434]TCP57802.1 Spo0E like sporulation regulatory protein [Tumebacillus sp. BK434]
MQIHLEEIERCRQQLEDVVSKHQGNLLHPIVLQASQQLDSYIVKYQHFKHNRRKSQGQHTFSHQ